MIKLNDDLDSHIQRVAERSVQQYAQGILTTGRLAEQIALEWQEQRRDQEEPSQSILVRIAQRICSRELCAAWRSTESDRRNHAFANLRRYLESSLRHSLYATSLQKYQEATEDVLHQTLVVLHAMLLRDPPGGPNDPAAFLKWTRTVVLRQAHAFLEERNHEGWESLDDDSGSSEDFIDKHARDPLEHVLDGELQEILKNAILSIKNPRYQRVLLYIYLVGMDEKEVAHRLQARVDDVYLWKHRALKMLRGKLEIIQVLRAWLDRGDDLPGRGE